MIDTVFYFTPDLSLTDYQALVNVDLDNGIAARTIVFASAQKAIYKGGQQYSVGDISSEISSYLTTNKYLKEDDLYFARFLTQQNLDGYLTSADLSSYALTSSLNSYALKSDLNEFYNGASYSNGILTLTKKGGGTTPITIPATDNTALGQLLTSLNSMNNPTALDTNKTLVWNGNSWTYGTNSGDTTYNAGSGIVINNNTISLKTGSVSGSKNYPVLTDSNGVPYVNVPWESTVYSGEYMINVNPSYIPVQVSSDGKGNLGEVLCAVDVRYNNTSVAGTLANPVIIRNGAEVSSNDAIQSGINASISGSNIKIKLTNVADFESNSLVIKSTVSHGGSNVGVAVVTLVGTIKAPASGADAVLLQTSADIVNIDWQHTAASPSAISAKLQIGTNVYATRSDIAAQGYRIFYKYRNDSQWTLLNGDITINPQKYAESLLIELRKGSSDEYANTQLFAAKEIPFIVDPAPAIGLTLYKINVLSTTIKHKEGTSVFSGDLTFAIIKDDQQYINTLTLGSNELSLSVESGGTEAASEYNDNIYYLLSSNDGIPVWTLTVNNIIYDNKARTHQYSHISLKNGQNYVLDSVIIPFIMEGADGSSSQQVQSIQGTVMRVLNYNSAESVCERTPWYTGDVPDTVHNVRFMDILHYTLNNEDYGYFVKKGTSGSVNHAPVEIIDGVEKINYSVNYQDVNGATYISGGSEWEQFQPMSEAVFNALLAKSAYIESLTAKELVITDSNNSLEAGMTSGSSTALPGVTRNNVRIWAGYPTNNNLYNCPFYVTNTGELHATKAIIEDGTFINKLTFERRKAYDTTYGAGNKPLQLARRLYRVTKGEVLLQYEGNTMYGVGTISLTTNHLFVLAKGAYSNDVHISSYGGENPYSELHLLLPPAHHFIGLSITITNESTGFLKPIENPEGASALTPCITLEQENLYRVLDGEILSGYPNTNGGDYICLTGKQSVELTQTTGVITQEGDVLITYDNNPELLSGIWRLKTVDSANGTYLYGELTKSISLDDIAWIKVTAAEGYQKEDYVNMSDGIKPLNAMWVVTGYAYKSDQS